ncbi:Rgp1-domain-containing protein [Choiromyces venosus 120613-1]|uniref:Rgp1-domain-containing protein n=1 Tax=Choiromyces venosus 120613-1 TaxID=1336337 RepID=A0A3N4K4Q5_9PEZI|nr:Rgp1-domain-containing protein [Choiromyces venosus 120613-1]
MSDIRVFVTFPESAVVFAGEKLECKITFKNTSPPSGSQRPHVPLHGSPKANGGFASGANGSALGGKAAPLQLPVAGNRSAATSPRIPSTRAVSHHKPSLSLSVPAAKSPVSPGPPVSAASNGKGHKHRRSISIVSLGSDAGIEGGGRGQGEEGIRSPSLIQGRQGRGGHSRSASLQTMPRRSPGLVNGSAPNSATMPPPPPRTNAQPSTPMIIESESVNNFPFPGLTSANPRTPGGAKPLPKPANKTFKFPPDPPGTPTITTDSLHVDEPSSDIPQLVRKVSHIDLRGPVDEPEYEKLQSRVISAHSVNGETPRSSGEFYSLSNSTTETLVSEYDPRAAVRPVRSTHNRRHSLLAIGPRSSESLMMGYAQVQGSFTLDGSLIQTSIFDEVKRKGVVGGQMGGGVVGLETHKADGGFLSGFGWGGIGGNITGFLGGNNMSSIAEMKNIANSRSIPILSTPQSILFVDLRLNPGESKSYTYSFTLPKGLPPTHRGKAIKVVYNLVIGTQRPGKGVQQPKVVEIPFRVFPHVHANGSLLVHDLMSPIVLLRDEATTACIDDQTLTPPAVPSPLKKAAKQESSLEDFLSYVDSLLAPRDGTLTPNSLGILSPSIPASSKRFSIMEEPQITSSKDAIEMAIRRGPGGSSDGHCSIFEIARNGRKVATLTLARPAYKLGETITAVVDFSNAKIPCYHITAILETSESVTPSIALRSASSIHRATRKLHFQHSQSTLFSKRVVFTPTIPTSATPEFSTSGVSCAWALRLEFVTPAQSLNAAAAAAAAAAGGGGGMDGVAMMEELLEQTHADDRGELFEAKQNVFVESFDASIPVRVYPNAAAAGEGIGNGGGIGGGASGGVGTGAGVGGQAVAAAVLGYVV